jgi:hypothetical protein
LVFELESYLAFHEESINHHLTKHIPYYLHSFNITIIAVEELTHKVLAGLKNNFAMSGLGHWLDMLLDKASMRLRLSLQLPTLAGWRWLPI